MIGTESDLSGNHLSLAEMNWLAPQLGVGDHCQVSTRYRSPLVHATVTECDDKNNGKFVLNLSESVRAITPGQSGVLYDEDERLLGGGVIQ